MDPSVLRQLQSDFELTDAQLAALPSLSEVELISQKDSHLIEHLNPTSFVYHSYKLFVGVEGDDHWHVYLRTAGSRRPYKLEICSVDLATKTARSPFDATYYGSVKDLAYPFNEFLGAQRFVAVVKWYFLLGLRTGLFDDDPGFAMSVAWRRELKGACDDLIRADQRESQERKRRRTPEAIRQANDISTASVATPKSQRLAGSTTPKHSPRKGLVPGVVYNSHSNTDRRQLEQPSRLGLGSRPPALQPRAIIDNPDHQIPPGPPQHGRHPTREVLPSYRQTNHRLIPREPHSTTPHPQRGTISLVELSRNRKDSDGSRLEALHRHVDVQEDHGKAGRNDTTDGDMRSEDAADETWQEEYLRLFRLRVEINLRLHSIEDALSIEERQALFEEIRKRA